MSQYYQTRTRRTNNNNNNVFGSSVLKLASLVADQAGKFTTNIFGYGQKNSARRLTAATEGSDSLFIGNR